MKFTKIIWGLVKEAAHSHGLDPCLVGAVVLTESSGETYAMRYERGYRYLFQPSQVKPKGCSTATEINAQQCSWGLMQVMGATARELGFRGWMGELCRPEIGLEYGCRYLALQVKRFGSVEAGVAALQHGVAPQGGGWEVFESGRVCGAGDEADEGIGGRWFLLTESLCQARSAILDIQGVCLRLRIIAFRDLQPK